MTWPRAPHTFGYLHEYLTDKEVRSNAKHSRNAFINLLSLCSFFMAYFSKHGVRLGNKWESIMQESSVHRSWLLNLALSSVNDFNSVQRVGALMDPYVSRWSDHIRIFFTGGTPIWIYWGNNLQQFRQFLSYNSVLGRLKPWAPTEAQFSDALAAAKEITLRSTADGPRMVQISMHTPTPITAPEPESCEWRPSPTPEPHPIAFGKPKAGSAQHDDEGWIDFFKRMKNQYDHRVQSENEKQKEAREKRKKYAGECGWSKGDYVYEWFNEGGFWIRSVVTSHLAEETWNRYPARQRRFLDSGFEIEWDLCLPMAPVSRDDYLDSDSDDEVSDFEGEHSGPHGITLLKTLALPLTSTEMVYSADLTASYSFSAHDAPTIQFKPLGVLIKKRYEFDPLPYLTPTPTKPNEAGNHVAAACRLGLMSEPAYERHLLDINETLMNPSIQLDGLDLRWDFSTLRKPPMAMDFGKLKLTIAPQGDERLLYLIGIPEKDLWLQYWVMAISNSSTVLQIVREGWGSIGLLEVARQLLTQGIPFNTVIFKHLLKEPKPLPFSLQDRSLGHRPHGYKPDTLDYLVYVDIRDDFLMTSKAARAALLMGGIVGRLVREVVPQKAVLNGVSKEAAQFGQVVGRYQGFQLIDDALDATALELICGVYFVDTAKGNDAEISWWPKHSFWQSQVGFNQGYWTPAAEDWFQLRLKSIKEGKAELYQSKKWKRLLRFDAQKTRAIHEKHDELCKTFIGKMSS